MKKIFTFLLIAALTALSASAVTVRLDIDDIDRVEALINDEQDVPGLKSGYNEIDVDPGTAVYIVARTGCSLLSVADTNGDYKYDMPIHAEDGRQFSIINVYSDYGDTYVIKSASQADTRTAQCTIKVDDPAKVKVVNPADESTVELTAGDNTYKFDPATESTLTIKPTGRPLYSVTVNGSEAAFNGYAYNVTLTDGCTVDILANFPDKDCPVKFVLSGDQADLFIRTVDVDGRAVADFMSDSFTVKAGSELSISAHTDEWQVTECTVNGVSATFSNPFNVFVTEATTIAISVSKYATFPMTINVDDPARIHAYRGYSYNNDEITLNAGANRVDITRNTPIVSFVPADGCYIKSLEVDGYEYADDELRVAPVMVGSLTDNSVITVTTGVIDRNMDATISVEPSLAGQVTLIRSDHSSVTLDGETTAFRFYEGDNPFTLELAAASDDIVVTVDGSAIAPVYPSSPKYSLTLANGSVVRVGSSDYSSIRLPEADIDAPARIYNLQGMPVDPSATLPSGLYIVNGKKILVR